MSGVHTVAIVGCGAVTEQYYIPSLRRLSERVQVKGLFDTAYCRAASFAGQLSGVTVTDSFEAVLELGADILVVASPPSVHAAQAIAGMRAGCAILCEKPLAPAAADALQMAAVSRETGRLLAVNMVRRQFPSSHIVKGLVATRSFGRLVSVEAFDGGLFHWPVSNQSYFSREVSGGGVLADIGSHIIDLLHWWFGKAEFSSYYDDEMGGVEANALLELRWDQASARIRLSRDWERPNAITLNFERATLRWQSDRLDAIEVRLDGSTEPLILDNPAARHIGFEDCFTNQIAALLDHLDGKQTEIVTAEQVLPTVALIERAYAAKSMMSMPWIGSYEGASNG
ncbi:MAG: Gfo/Idh/MocA family protein [Sphingobium sp.]